MLTFTALLVLLAIVLPMPIGQDDDDGDDDRRLPGSPGGASRGAW